MSRPNSVDAYGARRFPTRFERTRDGRAVTDLYQCSQNLNCHVGLVIEVTAHLVVSSQRGATPSGPLLEDRAEWATRARREPPVGYPLVYH